MLIDLLVTRSERNGRGEEREKYVNNERRGKERKRDWKKEIRGLDGNPEDEVSINFREVRHWCQFHGAIAGHEATQ